MSRFVIFIGAMSLIAGSAACKGQAERDMDEAARGVQGAPRHGMVTHDEASESGLVDLSEDPQVNGQMRQGATPSQDRPIGGGLQGASTMLTVQTKAPFGDYLADQSGLSLYIFEGDEEGRPSRCNEVCAEVWPPFVLEGGREMAGEVSVPARLDAALLGVIPRRDGHMQLSFNGMPLYYYAPDENPGETEGQGVEQFGDDWYLIAPSGDEIDDDDGAQENSEIMEDIGETPVMN